MATVSKENVLQALDVLLNNPSNELKQEASKYLERVQVSPQAWTVVDEILRENSNEQSLLFTAQTMRTKIKFHFHELPADVHLQLRDSLLSHIDRFSNGPHSTVLTQLVVALVDLMAYVVAWTDPLGDLLGFFGHRTDRLKTLLEILEVFPQETESRALRISDERLSALDDQLRSHGAEIMALLQTCLTTPEYQEKTHQCLGSCARIHVFSDEMLQQSPTLLTSPFEALHTPRLFDSAVEAICGLLQMTYYKINRYPNTINAMIQQVMALGPVYSQALGGGEETAEKAFGLARVFCTLSECYIDLILESVEGASVVQMMVLVASNAESRTCEMTFNFWHDLLDRLLRDRDQGARRSSGPEIDEQYTGPLREHFQQLIQHLTQHITYTDDSEPFDLLDDENDHTHFRKSAAYLIKRVSVLLGPMAVMFQIVDLYQEVLTHALEACGAASNGSAAWRQLEAVLYVSANVLQKVNSREELVIPDLLSVVRSLLDTSQVNGDGISVIPSPIRSSSLLVLANVAHWLRTHSQYTSTVISMACAHMQIMPSVCTAAVGAFVRVSRPCSREVLPSLDQIIGSTMQHFDTFAVTKTLSRDDVNDLYGALGYLLADVKPANHVTQRVALIIQPVLVAIDQSLPTGAQANNASSTSPNVGFLLDRITFVFKELKNLRWQEPSDTVGAGTGLIAGQQRAPANMHPCKQIVQQMWPNLERIYTVYQAHEPTIEKWTRCLKAVILCLGAESSVELVQPLVTCLVAGYTRYMHSPLAYLAVQVVRLYSPMPECYEGLSQILFAYVTPTLALLQPADTSTNAPGHPEDPLNTTKDPFNTHPDVVEDFFRLMMEYLTTMPVFFLTSQVASPVFLCAINALHGYHDDGLSTTSYFLRDLLSKCTSGKRLEERAAILGPIHALVQQHGQVLCNTVINAIGGSVPLRHLDKVAFVLYDLRCVCSSGQSPGPGSTGELVTKEHLSAWLENSLNAIPAHLVSETYKREFMLRVFSSPDERALDEAAYRFAQQFEGENKLIA